MPCDAEIVFNVDCKEFVCTQSKPLTLPIVRTWIRAPQRISGRPFQCFMDCCGVIWTNGSRGDNDGKSVYRRVTWRETLNLIQNYAPEILGDVIDAAISLQPHLAHMMFKYEEFAGVEAVQSRLPS